MLTERFARALIHAARQHADQTRKGSGVPYISHLMAVCALTIEYGGGEDEAIAALLHDAIEDQGGDVGSRQRSCANLARASRRLSTGCTDTDESPKPPWQARKEEYIRHVAEAIAIGAIGVGMR